MVRYAIVAVCLALGSSAWAQDASRAEHEAAGATMLWSYLDPTGAYYQIDRKEGAQDARLRIVTVWVAADHSKDRSVAYRRSVRRMTFDCAGSYQVSAFRSYMPDGSVRDDWDRLGQPNAVKPGTLAGSLEATVCAAAPT
jgi:hypothetical protein